jgi:hypothetical protein
MRTDYSPAKTFWCFDDILVRVYPITVVAETEKCLYLAPATEYNNRGHKIPPVLRHKRALPTFHSFHEAKHELMEVLAFDLAAAEERAVAKRNRLEELLQKASQLEAANA